MNVVIKRVTRPLVVISFTRKDEVLMRGRDPKDGYWEIVWTRKTDGVKVISGVLHKKTAERIAAVLNGLSKMEAKELVTTFHSKGFVAHKERQSALNNKHTSRPFPW